MKLALVATFILAGTSCCCGSIFERLVPGATDDVPAAVAPAQEAPAAEAPIAKANDTATGVATPATILASADAVSPFHPWTGALAEMERRLGKPTRIDGDRYAWAVMDGPDCVGTYMMHVTGPAMTTNKGSSTEQVGTYMAGQRFAASADNPYFKDCVADTGTAP